MSADPGSLLSIFGQVMGHWWILVAGTLLGLVAGAIPGFSAANALIVLLPLTLAMAPETAMIFMVAVYASARMGAGIPAILVNIPGTAGAAATPLDGYPMAARGEAQRALAIAFTASVLGGLLATIAALFLIAPLATLVFHLHSVEMIVVMLLGISLIATISAEDTIKGFIAGFFGLMIGFIGADAVYEVPRGTFGFLELYDKVPLVPALIGLFAISECLVLIEQQTVSQADISPKSNGWSQTLSGIGETLRRFWHVIWTGAIGLVIGVLPGAGAAIASFAAYQQSRAFSKTPQAYGSGHVEGLIAPESANNSVTAGTLVPLLILGVPGGATAAVMAVVLEYHGVQFGAELFVDHPLLGYGPFVAMAVTYCLLGLLIAPLSRALSKAVMVPVPYLVPAILTVSLLGAFVPRNYVFDIGVAIVFGLIGYLARRTGYHVAAILIGILLGPLLETYFLRAMKISQGDLSALFSSRLGNALWVVLILTLLLPAARRWMGRRHRETGLHEN